MKIGILHDTEGAEDLVFGNSGHGIEYSVFSIEFGKDRDGWRPSLSLPKLSMLGFLARFGKWSRSGGDRRLRSRVVPGVRIGQLLLLLFRTPCRLPPALVRATIH